jgi:hypothetical protein
MARAEQPAPASPQVLAPTSDQKRLAPRINPPRGGSRLSLGPPLVVVREPINPERAGWEFLNRVITAIATGSHGLGFDVFTGDPIP